ncbi:substrate-binding periplasmic protein [Shewanella jiangmenensis]|nr:transporter substrate-binding domain-containing protein [Shewanella jiangmenensis]
MPLKILLILLLILPAFVRADAGRTLQLVATELPPFYGESLSGHGPVAELVLEALSRRGYKTELHFYPFIRATALVKAGKADAIIGLWYRPEREQWAEYSQPLQKVEIGFLARKESALNYSALSELKQKLIGISRGYANPQAIAANGLHTEEADSDETNLRKLHLKRLDLIVISRHVGAFLIKRGPEDYQGQFEFVGEVLATEQFHLGVSRALADHEALTRDFNGAIDEMRRDGSMAAILSKLSTEPD